MVNEGLRSLSSRITIAKSGTHTLDDRGAAFTPLCTAVVAPIRVPTEPAWSERANALDCIVGDLGSGPASRPGM